MSLSFQELRAEDVALMNSLFPTKDCFIEVLPGHVVLPRKFKELGDSIRDLDVFDDDVWLVSYPRTGSTWAQEMIWLLGNKLDFEGAKQMQQLRSPLLELSAMWSEDHSDWLENSVGNTIDVVRKMPRPRFTRSHMTWDLLPRKFESVKPKIIYTARNPKDMCVSFYNYCQMLHGMKGPFESFLELFLRERSPMGSYWNHVLPFWKRRKDANILFIKYEDMQRDLAGIVRKCAKFMDVELADEDVGRVCEHLKFDKMKTNPAVNLEQLLNTFESSNGKGPGEANGSTTNGGSKFIRKGKIGDWKNYFTQEQSHRFDEWIELNSSGSDLIFDYE